ncbi:MAG: hypothetical protein NHB15_14075 [Methanosarcina barkeri]|nr:hypothetical protein [Methanosarcina sp. ERenArc_MAG2]
MKTPTGMIRPLTASKINTKVLEAETVASRISELWTGITMALGACFIISRRKKQD